MTPEQQQVITNMNTIMMLKEHFKYMGVLYYGSIKHYLSVEEYEKKFGQGSDALTDGKEIYYKLDKNFTTPHAIFITIHELLHIISSHIFRRKDRDPILWNVACDHVVNSLCKKIENNYGDLEVSKDSIYFSDLELENPNYTVEEVYDIMKDKAKDNKITIKVCSGNDGNEGEGENDKNSSGNSSNSKYIEVTFTQDQNQDENQNNSKKSGKGKNGKGSKSSTMTAPMDVDDKNLQEIFKDSEIEKNFQELKTRAEMYWTVTKNSSSMGKTSSDLESYLEEIFKVEIPWDKLLENAILYQVQRQSKRSWEYPNILVRYPRLPGKKPGTKHYHSLISVIDSSGSLTDEDLKTFRGVLISSGSYFKNIFVIVHDHEIKQFFNIKDPNEQKIFEGLRSIKGRGGTSHKQVFDKIEDLVTEEKISSIIFLTDFYSDVEYIIKDKDYKFLKDYHTIWVLNKHSAEVRLYDQSKFETIRL